MREVSIARGEATVCARCGLAESTLQRLKGLLGRGALARDEGLLIRPANSVHTAFMRFPIDVVFLDRDLRVLRVVPELRPWRAASQRRSRAVLELAAGAAAAAMLEPGNQLELRDG